MAKYFGTDGIRGKANETLTIEIAYKVGRYLGYYCKNHGKSRICIGKDTRISSSMFEHTIAGGLAASGCNVYLLGYCSTPCLAYVSEHDDFDFGVMISASHNPFYDNGIKVFSNNGMKINEQLEGEIENYIDNESNIDIAINENIGSVYDYKEGLDHYKKWIKEMYPSTLENFNVLVDCANGSNSFIAEQVLTDLKCNVKVINNNPNGININKDCGSTHLDMLKQEIKNGNYDFGFAFDGDADRVLFVDKDGETVDGDMMMYILSKYLKKHNKLKDDVVVTTVMSNIGLYKVLEKENFKSVTTSVGDKNVLDEMIKGNYSVGGEQSGHIILLNDSRFGDGLKTALCMMNAIKESGKTLKELKSEIEIYPQLLENITVKDKNVVLNDNDINKAIEEVKDLLSDNGRILVRPSGTEPLIRVMVEAKTQEICKEYVSKIIELIKEKGYQK